jgi:hypothetical protein
MFSFTSHALERATFMRRIFGALLGFLVGYPIFAFAGYWAIALFSSNGFDRSVEASMTAIFAIGPIGAFVGLIAGYIVSGRTAKSRRQPPSDKGAQ